MSKYGSGISFDSACRLEKAEIRKALDGKVLDRYDEEGMPVYRDGTKEEIADVIIGAYDAVVNQVFQAMASSKALERMYKEDCNKPLDISVYAVRQLQEVQKFTDYVYDGDTTRLDTQVLVDEVDI